MALTDNQIAGILEEELSLSEGEEHGDLEAVRELALKYFKNDPKGTELPGRSHINSGDFADMVEAIMAELMPIFSGQSLVLFESTSEEDEDQARLESDFVQHMIERNGGYMVIAEAVKDALMMRNGFIRVEVEEEQERRSESVGELEEAEQLALTAQLQQQGWEKVTVTDTRVTVQRTNRSLKICSPRPEDIRYSSEHDKQELEGIRFFAEREELTRTELIRMGIPKAQVNDMAPIQDNFDGAAQRRREDSRTANLASPSKANDVIETWNVYAMIDEDESGVAELRRYRWIPNSPKLIYEKDDAKMIPFAHGSPYIFPHRVTGWSVFDKLKAVEDAKTYSLRQMLDNMNNMNNTRKICRKGAVNKESLLNSRPGGVIWADDPTSDVIPEQKVAIINESIGAMNYLDKLRTEKGGASLDMINPEFQLAGKNAGDFGIERQLSKKEKLVGMMALNLANTLIKRTYMLVHEQMRLFMPGQLQAKLNGVWAQTDPSQWAERKHLTVHVGMTDSERTVKLMALEKLIEGQRGLAQAGFDDVMVTEKNIYNAMRDWMQLQDFSFPDQYLQDPESKEAQRAKQVKFDAQQQQMQEQQQLQQGLVDVQNMLEKYKVDMQTQVDVLKENVKMAIEEAKLEQSAAAIDEQQAQTNGTQRPQ